MSFSGRSSSNSSSDEDDDDDDAEALLRGVQAVDAEAVKLATAEADIGVEMDTVDEEEDNGDDDDDEDDDDDGPALSLRVYNVVSTFNLNTKVDLDRIASTARNAEYNPRK
jgi:hypothetical protein